jgi:hypothetical protein
VRRAVRAGPRGVPTRSLIAHFHYMLGFTYADRDWPRARCELEQAAAVAPDDDVPFYNLDLLYWRLGLLDPAAVAFARSDAINPRHLASASRPRAADRLAEVEAQRDATVPQPSRRELRDRTWP